MPQEVVIRETKEDEEKDEGISWTTFFVWCFIVVGLAVFYV